MTPSGLRHCPSLSRLIWTLVLLGSVVHVLAAADARSVLRNGDFSEDPKSLPSWMTADGGGLGTFETVASTKQGEPPHLKITVTKPSPAVPWAMRLEQAVAAPIAAGEVFYLTFECRITSGYVCNAYWQKAAPPWDKYLSLRLTSSGSSRWEKCAIAVRATSDLGDRQSSLTFHLAEQRGVLELRQLSALVYPPEVDVADLPITAFPVVGGDYYDDVWLEKARDRLRRARMSKLTVKVTTAGKPLPDAQVKITQKQRAFLVGVDVPAPLFSDEALARPALATYARRIKDVSDKLPLYRQKILSGGLFNLVSFKEAFRWAVAESWGDTVLAEVVPLFVEGGVAVRGHALYCPSMDWVPPVLAGAGKDKLERALFMFAGRRTTKYKGMVTQWDTLHAALTNDDVYDIIGTDSLVNIFKVARDGAGETMLLLSDEGALASASDEPLDKFLDLLEWLVSEQGTRVDGLAFQVRMSDTYVAPQTIEAHLDYLYEVTELPVMITGLSIDAVSAEIQAEIMHDLLTLFYSHHSVAGVCLSDVWAASDPNQRSVLYERDLTPKPAAQVVEKMLTQDWWTTASITTDTDGICAVTGYHGAYDIAVTIPGKTAERQVDLPPGGTELAVNFDD